MSTEPAIREGTVRRNIPADLIEDAYRHVYEAAIRTPLVRLNCEGPAEIYLKLECLQPIGSFKIRGAYNAVRLLPEEQRLDGECRQRGAGSSPGDTTGRRDVQGPGHRYGPGVQAGCGATSGSGNRQSTL